MSVGNQNFDYDTFVALNDSGLVNYVVEFLADTTRIVPEPTLEKLAAELFSYDEYHRVCAIELLSDRRLERICEGLPSHMRSEYQSVRLAASRALSRIPEEHITPELIRAVDAAIRSGPDADFFEDVVDDLRRRMRADDSSTAS
jgi:hypothetical protein